MGDFRPRKLERMNSKPPTYRSHVGITLVEPNKVRLVRGESLPPWQQPVQIILGSERSSGLQVTDFWTLKMRKDIVKSFFPTKGVSKVAAVFNSTRRKEREEKILKHWRRTKDEEALERLSTHTSTKLPSLAVSPTHLHANSPRTFKFAKRSLL